MSKERASFLQRDGAKSASRQDARASTCCGRASACCGYSSFLTHSLACASPYQSPYLPAAASAGRPSACMRRPHSRRHAARCPAEASGAAPMPLVPSTSLPSLPYHCCCYCCCACFNGQPFCVQVAASFTPPHSSQRPSCRRCARATKTSTCDELVTARSMTAWMGKGVTRAWTLAGGTSKSHSQDNRALTHVDP